MPVDPSIALLAWYGRERRSLPWRAGRGETPDPYRVWLSEIMLQQTTVAAVRPRFEAFTRAWPTLEALAAADEDDVMSAWAGLGYYARARNLIACARHVSEAFGGRFPDTEAGLLALPGVGAYTAAAVAAIAFDRRAVVVDGNVERVVARLFAIDAPLPAARRRLRELAGSITPQRDCGDHAQAMMDLGSMVCTPRDPACDVCPLGDICAARASGAPERFPVRAVKAHRPRRVGRAFWLEHDGDVLLVRRPAKGLLGGMLGFPSGRWSAASNADEGAPIEAGWEDAGAVDHVFTHFALTLHVRCAHAGPRKPDGLWWPIERLHEAGLPTLFAKAAQRGRAWRSEPPLFAAA